MRDFCAHPMGHDDPTPPSLTCRDVTAFVMDYLDDVLPTIERAAFEAHLAACPDCVVYLASYREAVRLAKTHGTVDDHMPEELVQAILAARLAGRS